MPPKLALLIVVGVIVWLIFRDRKSRDMLSSALWLPVIWGFIIGSRPVSEWLGSKPGPDAAPIDYLEGSPLDRMIFFALIAAGLFVLFIRRQRWAEAVWNNKWLFIFYFYLLLSVLWSEFPFVSFKRFIKDFGNVVMALVVFSEINPYEAAKSVLLRCSCLLIPLSAVAVKYFPETGRYYDRWSYTAYFSGIAGDKNLLGMTLFVCGLFLFNMYLESGDQPAVRNRRILRTALIAMMLMTLWLLMKAHSVTAIVCTVLSAGILLVLKSGGPKKLVIYVSMAAVIAVFVSSAFNLTGMVAGLLGRDVTLTGRTEIWKILLSERINPLIGTGFYSFWLGSRSEDLSEQYHFTLNEAHNGYIETYLNSGILGLALLLLLLGFALRSRWNDLRRNMPAAAFQVAFLIGTIVYNISEATFNRLSIIWFAFMLAVLHSPGREEEVNAATPLEAPFATAQTKSLFR